MMERSVLVLGDLHGCAAELDEALRTVDIDTIDLVVFAGDLIDKGADTVGVVKRARKLASEVDVVLVEGNHEARFRAWRQMSKRDQKQHPNADFYRRLMRKLSKADLRFLDTARLYYQIPEHDVIVVHGGVPPKMRSLPPASMRAVERLSKKQSRAAKLMQTIRRVKGRFWAKRYDGRFGTALFGHQPFKQADEPVAFAHAIGLDLGCASGNALGGAVLRPGSFPEFVATASAYTPNAEVKVLPNLYGDDWIGYRIEGDRWVAIARGSTPAIAYHRARES